MIDQKKVKLMAGMSIIKKNQSEEEQRINGFYKRDYVYINNWKTRISVTIVFALIVGWYYFDQVYNSNLDLLSLDYKAIIWKLVLVYGALMVGFSMLSTYVYSKRYEKLQRTNKKYCSMLKNLVSYMEDKE